MTDPRDHDAAIWLITMTEIRTQMAVAVDAV